MTTNDSWSHQDNPHQATGEPFPASAAPGRPEDAQVQDAPPTSYQAPPGQLSNQAPLSQLGNQGYQGMPTPMGYQGNPNQFQPGYGPTPFQPYSSYRMGGIGRASQQLSGKLGSGNLGAMITGAVFGFGPLGGRRGRFRYLWYIRIALFLIALGAILYVGFVKHQWVVVCHNCDTGGGGD